MNDIKYLTLEEYYNLTSQMRYYYRKYKPEYLKNIPEDKLTIKKGGDRKRIYHTDEERKESNRLYQKRFREKKKMKQGLYTFNLGLNDMKGIIKKQIEEKLKQRVYNDDIFSIDDILYTIYEGVYYSEQRTFLFNMMFVSKKFYKVYTSNFIWKKFFNTHYGYTSTRTNHIPNNSFLLHTKLLQKVKYLESNYHIWCRLEEYKIKIFLHPDKESLVLKYNQRIEVVKKDYQNKTDIIPILNKLILSNNSFKCPQCTINKENGIVNQYIVDKETKNYGKIYYRCNKCKYFRWENTVYY